MSAPKPPNHDDQKLKSKALKQEFFSKKKTEMDVIKRKIK
jgi:hypothetical protein